MRELKLITKLLKGRKQIITNEKLGNQNFCLIFQFSKVRENIIPILFAFQISLHQQRKTTCVILIVVHKSFSSIIFEALYIIMNAKKIKVFLP